MQKTQVSAKSVHLQIFTLAILTLCHNEAQAKNDISRGAYLSQATSIGSPYFPKNDLYSTRQKLTLPSANQNKENNVLPNSRGPDCNAFFTAAGSNAVVIGGECCGDRPAPVAALPMTSLSLN